MISRNRVAALGAVLVLAAVAPAAPAAAASDRAAVRVAALPLPRVSGHDAAPAADPRVQPDKRARRACVFGVFPAGHGRCFAASGAPVAS